MADDKVGNSPITQPITPSTPIRGTGDKSSPASGVTGAKTSSGKPIIPAGEFGGTYSLDFYNREMGIDLSDPLEAAEEEEASKEMEEILRSEKEKSKEEPQKDSEQEEDGELEVEPDALEDSESTKEESEDEKPSDKKFIKAKDPSGKEIDLDPNLIILKKVDGEVQEIRLEDHLDIVAGELTVNQRLGKLASFKDTLEKKLEFAQKRETQFVEGVKGLQAKLAEDPVKGFVYAAQMAGESPVEMFRKIMASAEQAARQFEGKSQAEVDNMLLKMEIDYERQKAQAEKKTQDSSNERKAWEEKLFSVLNEEKISQDEFKAATMQLSKEESWKSMSPDERADAAIEKVLHEKHDALVTGALKKVNPNLVKNTKLVALVKEHTHPNKWTQAEVESLVRQLVKDEEKRIATSLNKKVGTQQKPATSQKTDAKPTKKTVTTHSDLERAFGLGSKY